MFFFYCFNFVIFLFGILLLFFHLKKKNNFPFNFVPNKYEIVMILFILLNQIYIFIYNFFYVKKMTEKNFFLFSKLKSLEFIYFQFLIILSILARTNNLINIFNKYFISLSNKFTLKYFNNNNNNSFNIINNNNISSINSINNNSINTSINNEDNNFNDLNFLDFRSFIISVLFYSIFIYIIMGLNDNSIFFEGITFIYYEKNIKKDNKYLFGFIIEFLLFLFVLIFLIKKFSFLLKFPINSDKFYFKFEIFSYILIIYLNSFIKIFLFLFYFKENKNKNISLINDSIINIYLLIMNFILCVKRWFFYRNLNYLKNNRNFILNFDKLLKINSSFVDVFKMYLNRNCEEKINQLYFYLIYLEFKEKYENKMIEKENEIHLKLNEIFNQFFNQDQNLSFKSNFEFYFIECPLEIKEKLNNLYKKKFNNENLLNCYDEVFKWIKKNLENEFNKLQQNSNEKDIIIKILFFMECFDKNNQNKNIFLNFSLN